jgi:serine phosphatase RsbU (regulator of sigma subunit)
MAAFLTKPLLYGVAVSITALCTLLAILLETVITPDHPGHVAVLVFLVGVILSARVCHLGPALLAAGLSYVTADYLFIPPLYSVDFGWNDVPLIGCFVLTAGVVDLLTKKRFEAEKALDVSKEKMRLAQAIQQRLFPVAAPALSDFDVAGASYPAEATGGDYFDYIPMQDGAIGIVLGDVSGHGFGSALLMAETRAYLRALALTHDDVSQILTLTNRILVEDTEYERFMTLFFARLDPHSRSFVYAGAGHEGYLFGPSGKTARKLPSTSLPLGLDVDSVIACAPAIELEPGEILLLISDGLSETQARTGGVFGIRRVLEVVQANRSKTSREILEVLFHATRGYVQRDAQDDDMTAVILKRK